MISQILSAAAAIGLLGAGIVSSAETRSFQAMTPLASLAGANMCRIDVVRTGAAGTSETTRQVLGDGSCVCTIMTGPSGANGSAEAAVDALRNAGSCEGSAAAVQGSTQAAGGASGTLIGVGLFAGVAAAAAAFGGGNKADSPGGSPST